MAVVFTLKPIRLNGTILQSGEKIRVEDEQNLVKKGYARKLTKDEARTILDEYVAYADTVFNKPRTIDKERKPSDKRKVQSEQLSLFK
jgi:hypothetical protein